MTLAGGETAQMPDLYPAGHYDLAGTIVGVVSEKGALHGDQVRLGGNELLDLGEDALMDGRVFDHAAGFVGFGFASLKLWFDQCDDPT